MPPFLVEDIEGIADFLAGCLCSSETYRRHSGRWGITSHGQSKATVPFLGEPLRALFERVACAADELVVTTNMRSSRLDS